MPKGIIIFLHGYNNHTNRYAHVARKFSKAGYDTVGFDFEGFG